MGNPGRILPPDLHKDIYVTVFYFTFFYITATLRNVNAATWRNRQFELSPKDDYVKLERMEKADADVDREGEEK